jgi:hypothetical protein
MKKSNVNRLSSNLVICTGLLLCSWLLYGIEVVSSLHVYNNSVQTIIGRVMLHSRFRYCKVNKDMFKFILDFDITFFFHLLVHQHYHFLYFQLNEWINFVARSAFV